MTDPPMSQKAQQKRSRRSRFDKSRVQQWYNCFKTLSCGNG